VTQGAAVTFGDARVLHRSRTGRKVTDVVAWRRWTIRPGCAYPELDRTQPVLPMEPGHADVTHDQARHSSFTLFTALEVATRTFTGPRDPAPTARAPAVPRSRIAVLHASLASWTKLVQGNGTRPPKHTACLDSLSGWKRTFVSCRYTRKKRVHLVGSLASLNWPTLRGSRRSGVTIAASGVGVIRSRLERQICALRRSERRGLARHTAYQPRRRQCSSSGASAPTVVDGPWPG
jgi:hypothetical protein